MFGKGSFLGQDYSFQILQTKKHWIERHMVQQLVLTKECFKMEWAKKECVIEKYCLVFLPRNVWSSTGIKQEYESISCTWRTWERSPKIKCKGFLFLQENLENTQFLSWNTKVATLLALLLEMLLPIRNSLCKNEDYCLYLTEKSKIYGLTFFILKPAG